MSNTSDRKCQIAPRALSFENEHIPFHPILDVIGVGILVVDKDGHIQFANRMYERLTNLKYEDIAKKHISEVTNLIVDELLHARIVNTTRPGTVMLSNPRGHNIVFNGRPVFDKNKNVLLVAFYLRDITLVSQQRLRINNLEQNIAWFHAHLRSMQWENTFFEHTLTEKYTKKKYLKDIIAIAKNDNNIIIVGEHGTDKNAIARIIHIHSSRAKNPFLHIDCDDIDSEKIETFLFGSLKGLENRMAGGLGVFEIAQTGTVHLENFICLENSLQERIVLLLQENNIAHAFLAKQKLIDIKIILSYSKNDKDAPNDSPNGTASSSPILEMFAKDKENFFCIPALRKRKDEIRILAEEYLLSKSKKIGKDISFHEETLDAFEEYSWPGNSKQLQELVNVLAYSNRTGIIQIADLPSFITNTSPARGRSCPAEQNNVLFSQEDLETKSLKEILAEVEQLVLHQALDLYGSVAEVAKHFQMDRSTISRKIHKKTS